MKNIKALRVIDPSAASIFVTEALRYYCQEVTGKQSRVELPGDIKSAFEKIACQYMAWEDGIIRRKIKIVDARQQQEFRKSLSLINEVPWEKIEFKTAVD